MRDEDKTKEQLIDELSQFRQVAGRMKQIIQRVGKIKESESRLKAAEDQSQRQLEFINLLIAGAQKLAANYDIETLTQDICRTAVEVFGARLAWLGRAEPDGRVHPLYWAGDKADFLNEIEVRWDDSPLGQGPTGQAIRTNFYVVSEVVEGENPTPLQQVIFAQHYRVAAAFPLISGEKTFGSLSVYSDRPNSFNWERMELLQTYSNIASAALENVRLLSETEGRLQRITTLHAIDMAINSSLDIQVTLSVFIDQVTSQLNLDAADVLLLNPHLKILEYAAGRGFRATSLPHENIRLGQGYAGRAALERKIISIPNLQEEEAPSEHASWLASEGFIAYFAAPLIAKGQVKGVLEIFHRAPLATDPEWLSFIEALATQAAIAIDNATMFDDLQTSNIGLALAYDTTIEGWSRALDLRDKETEGHTQRVTEMTLSLARAVGMGDSELVHIRRGALLHDIGKMGIPDSILLKPGPLNDEERQIMCRHPDYAYEMLSPIVYLRSALDIPYCHHEKWDGNGYPRELKGETIPLAARLFALADVWDALRSDRPYRKGWTPEKVEDHIRSLSGSHFEPQVVEVFLEIVLDKGEGWESKG